MNVTVFSFFFFKFYQVIWKFQNFRLTESQNPEVRILSFKKKILKLQHRLEIRKRQM